MDLDELPVRVASALLIGLARGGAGVDDAVRRAAEDDAAPARREAHGVPGERAHRRRLHVLSHDAAADALVVGDEREEVPPLELAYHALARDPLSPIVLDVDRLPAPDLLVERIEELLAGRRPRERRAVKERSAEAAKVEQPLGRAVEGHAHAVEHEDDARRGVAHGLDRRLVREEVAAVDGLFEVHLRRVALALGVDAGVDAALRTDRVRSLDRDEREEVDGDALFAELDDRHQAGKPAAHHDDPADIARFATGARGRLCHVDHGE